MEPVADGGPVALDGLPLRCGHTYHLAVRATNCAGLSATAASGGATLCCAPPSAGVVRVLDAQGAPRAFASNTSELWIAWE
eukprot:6573720-Prymnesium_polylepis.1